MWRGPAMPAFDVAVARRWKGRVVLDRGGTKLGSVLDVFYDADNDERGGRRPGPGPAAQVRA
jgi:hypothetical protein